MAKIYDALHGFIHFDEDESALIDSPPFQRLHYIHQLGIIYLVYPGATHTRFEHSLGVLEVASRIYDQIIKKDALEYAYWRKVIRLGALCHDLGHLPFSHVAEKVLLAAEGHEKWTLAIIQSHYLRPIWEKMEGIFGKNVESDVIKMAIGAKKLQELGREEFLFTPWEKTLSEIISGDFFGADRIDYLLRDAKSTGVAFGLFDYHQLIEMLRILPLQGQERLGIEENGIASCEALLLARHFMHRRIYQYATVKAYSFHLARLMKKTFGDKKTLKDLEHYLNFTECEVLGAIHTLAKERNDLDAKALLDRSLRFKVIAIADPDAIHRLEEIVLKMGLPPEAISWEVARKEREETRLSFPVLKAGGNIEEASRISEIIIPSGPIGWIYVQPQYEKKVRDNISL